MEFSVEQEDLDVTFWRRQVNETSPITGNALVNSGWCIKEEQTVEEEEEEVEEEGKGRVEEKEEEEEKEETEENG